MPLVGRPTLGVKPQATTVPKNEQAKQDPNVVKIAKDAKLTQDSDPVKQLFEKLAEEKKKVGEKPVAIDRLAALVKAQVDKFAAEGKPEFKNEMVGTSRVELLTPTVSR